MASIICYGIIIPLAVSMPKIAVRLYPRLKAAAPFNWLGQVELMLFVVIILNAPASLFLHDMGFQYDRFLHFMMGFVWMPLLLALAFPLIKLSGHQFSKRSLAAMVFAIVFVCLFLWEGLQFSIDRIFGTKLFFDTTQPIQLDFTEDIIFGFAGAVAGTIYIFKSRTFREYL